MDIIEFAAKCVDDEGLGKGFVESLKDGTVESYLSKNGVSASAQEIQQLKANADTLAKIGEGNAVRGY